MDTMNTSLLIQTYRLECDEMLRLLACLIFEIQVNMIEKDPPRNIIDHLESLIAHAPPAVLPLVEHLRCNPPQERAGQCYTYSLPFVQWRCEQTAGDATASQDAIDYADVDRI